MLQATAGERAQRLGSGGDLGDLMLNTERWVIREDIELPRGGRHQVPFICVNVHAWLLTEARVLWHLAFGQTALGLVDSRDLRAQLLSASACVQGPLVQNRLL